jgi:hypothetical protein
MLPRFGGGLAEPAQPPERQHAPQRFGEFRIARHRGHLILPQIDEAVGERVEVGRLRHRGGV